MKQQPIVVAGAGASGMMAAVAAAREGASVILLEGNDIPGKKILSTGNGKCNFTNMRQEPLCYRSENTSFPWQALGHFNSLDAVAFFTDLGIYSRNRDGYLYPQSGQAAVVREMLEAEVRRLGVQMLCGVRVQDILRKGTEFLVRATGNGMDGAKKIHNFRTRAVILATGSKASRISGSDGSGYGIARKLGHTVLPVLPALVQLKCKEKWFKSLAGVRVQGKVSLYVEHKLAASDQGEIQLTDYGISGIPVFQVSRFASCGLYEKKNVEAVLDFMPDFSEEAFRGLLEQQGRRHPERSMELLLSGFFPDKLGKVLCRAAKLSERMKAGKCTAKDWGRLVRACKFFTAEVWATNAYEQAQVCCGGVDTRELSPDTMESRLVPGLFFAGEIIDVDGICGGYNLQWAWTSGQIAGKGAAKCLGSVK